MLLLFFSFIYLETSVAVLEEIDYLFRSCNTGIDISFCGLGSHLFGCSKLALRKQLMHLLVGSWHHVRHIAEVSTLLHKLNQLILINHLLARGIH